MSRKTYRALSDGFISGESRFVKEGEIFSTDAKPGSWMEEVSNAEAKKEAKAAAEILEEEQDKPDGSGPSADTLKRAK